MKFEGKIKSVSTQHIETEEGEKDVGRIVIDNGDEKVVFTGEKDTVLGYSPEDSVVVSISKANKTIQEATMENVE